MKGRGESSLSLNCIVVRPHSSIVLESLTGASLLIAAPLLSLLPGAAFATKERPFAHSLSLLDASATRLAAASPGTPWMPASVN